MRLFATLLLVLALGLTAACGSKSGGAPAQPAGGGKHVDPATAGSITGKVTFEGPAPAPVLLKMAADPACEAASGPAPQGDAVIVNNGALQNVFVYVKEGLDPSYSFDVPTKPLEFDQHGCRYVPHIFGVRVGQPIEIVNDDSTMHNVHALPKTNTEFNRMMQIKGEKMTHTFTTPEVMVRFKCDVHGWMAAYVGVMTHPFFAVSKADGSFEIAGLPPGTYTIEAWHEKFGTQTQKVTIADKQTQPVSFAFAPKS